MKTYEQLEKEQDKLDKEIACCPECGIETTYGEIKKFGSCMECYFKAYHKEKKK